MNQNALDIMRKSYEDIKRSLDCEKLSNHEFLPPTEKERAMSAVRCSRMLAEIEKEAFDFTEKDWAEMGSALAFCDSGKNPPALSRKKAEFLEKFVSEYPAS